MPQYYRLVFEPTGRVVADRIVCARSVLQKGIGLIGRRELGRGEGLWLPGVDSVHTFGVRFPIDILFLNADFRTTLALGSVGGLRICTAPKHTAHCIELCAGTLVGDEPSIDNSCWAIQA